MKKKVIEKNSRVEIIKGKHKGLEGRVVQINKEVQECAIELKINDEKVLVGL